MAEVLSRASQTTHCSAVTQKQPEDDNYRHAPAIPNARNEKAPEAKLLGLFK
jgi:hypothetical protein